MSNGLFSFFYNLFSTSHSHNSDVESTDIHGTNFGQMFEDSPGINPATGLPMISSGGVDVAGNPYGTDLSNDQFSSSSIDYCDSGSTYSSHDDCWNSSSSSGFSDDWNSSSSNSFDDNW
jgi:hypothetical protein